jgi:hypothetical protein
VHAILLSVEQKLKLINMSLVLGNLYLKLRTGGCLVLLLEGVLKGIKKPKRVEEIHKQRLCWIFLKKKQAESRFGGSGSFFVTDLSVAGLPAELKHITQRRKIKQP